MFKSKKILFLYTHIMGYTFSCLKKLIDSYEAEVTLIRYKENSISPYNLPNYKGLLSYDKSPEILKTLNDKKYDLVYVPGWIDKDYLKIAAEQKEKGAIVVAGCDTQWDGSLRQRLGVFYSVLFLKKIITYFWVPGIYQYEFVRKLGYSRNQILFNLYSADIELFENAFSGQNKIYPHNILFVGRFVKEKGIDLLVESYEELKNEHHFDWNLTLIGDGPLKAKFVNKGYQIENFMQPEALVKIVNTSGIFCLPSIWEPWGVVVHEFAAAGLPLLVSNVCGSSTVFVKHGYNGYIFESRNKLSLKKHLLHLINSSDEELRIMGNRSKLLSHSITPEIWASTLMNTLKI
jgi:glycosyltransferase involved in cell wall biosynthesis